jgi:hypothetical protein
MPLPLPGTRPSSPVVRHSQNVYDSLIIIISHLVDRRRRDMTKASGRRAECQGGRRARTDWSNARPDESQLFSILKLLPACWNWILQA